MDTDTFDVKMLIASTLSAAGLATGSDRGAAQAIMWRIVHGEPIPPDYYPETERCIELLRRLADMLEGTA